ncbi:hypothetical protein ACIQ8D_03915 [Streptomyces sp. NPDC096094]|uniref:hypothetical protein n=1 Tax=Streptomyces sp. NPDC096094 TaxID=3366073 RepID=UPI00380B075C
MTASGPGSGATPEQPDQPEQPGGTPSVPEHVWRQFLEDDERAIRACALREPAARDRAPGWRPGPPDGTDTHTDADTLAGRPSGVVGDLWHPEDPWTGPAWRALDGRARVRRVGRVIGTAAAVALALTAWSQLSTGTGTPGGGPAETIGQHLEESPLLESPVLPTAASLAPTASGDASPAVFEPTPSAVPRASSSWTVN